MKLLLDSNVLVPLTRDERTTLSAQVNFLLDARSNDFFVSTASLWEIAIKTRLGKLDPSMPLPEIPGYFLQLGYAVLNVDDRHAMEDLIDQPNMRDPFDRVLLAQCQIEGLQLVTTDRVLKEHPLAWRPA